MSNSSDPTLLLQHLRDRIDNIDAALIYMLAERFRCTEEVGHLKAQYALPPCDPERENKQIERLEYISKDSGLNTVFCKKLFDFIVKEVIENHKKIAKEKQKEPKT